MIFFIFSNIKSHCNKKKKIGKYKIEAKFFRIICSFALDISHALSTSKLRALENGEKWVEKPFIKNGGMEEKEKEEGVYGG